ncbi:MAG: ABC transporter ATP-binding protein [Frankia sp.]|nr:ABC transporter ATP-binding protein [Frankia sp.]
MADAVIDVRGLRKRYGGTEAVRGIDLDVAAGECFAFLGPNGAGKTTTVEILEGYRRRDTGDVRVLGVDPAHGGPEWRARIGIVLQESKVQPELTVREVVSLYAGYYPRPRGVDETVEQVGLAPSRDVRVARLSGGQQRRLDVALALVGDPELLFLDEPTTGFDPAARRNAWELVAALRELGKTVFLTTHYMDEAQALADRVAIIHDGEIVSTGTPDELGGRGEAPTRIEFRLPIDRQVRVPKRKLRAEVDVDETARRVTLQTREPVVTLHELTAWALAQDLDLDALTVSRPSLEDVYLALTAAS